MGTGRRIGSGVKDWGGGWAKGRIDAPPIGHHKEQRVLSTIWVDEEKVVVVTPVTRLQAVSCLGLALGAVVNP